MTGPDRGDIVNRLVALRDRAAGGRSEASEYVGEECRVAVYALIQGSNALARHDSLGGLQYLRLLAETTIRLRWIAGDDEDAPTPDGRLKVDPDLATHRTLSMKKRDLRHLVAAYRAIREAGGSSSEGLTEQLSALADRIAEPLAPREMSTMAITTTARRVYAGHRLCSTMIHPGATLGRTGLMPRDRLEEMIDDTAVVCWVVADGVVTALA